MAVQQYRLEPTYTISYLFRRILVPVDGSESSMRALDVALDFAQRYGSRVTVVHVTQEPSNVNVLRDKVLERATRKGVEVGFKTRVYSPPSSSVANEIIEEIIEGGYDLVIMGARGSTINEEILVGSTALSVMVNSAVSVMIIR